MTMKKVREALKHLWNHDTDAAFRAALAEVEETERLLTRQEDENRQLFNRANAAEAEADRLKAALRDVDTIITQKRLREMSPYLADKVRAALVPADRNTT